MEKTQTIVVLCSWKTQMVAKELLNEQILSVSRLDQDILE